MKHYIYNFSEGESFGRDLLGGKGKNLAEMTKLGMSVPPGFIITTEACKDFLDQNKTFPEGLLGSVTEKIKELEGATKKGFGSSSNPLLVSVRSGAAISMPGMMDTVLNLGLNDETVEGLSKKTKNPRFAYDAYRRFIQMFGNVVLKIKGEVFEAIIEEEKQKIGKKEDTELEAAEWKEVIEAFKKAILQATDSNFPQDPYVQLQKAIRAVFESCLSPKALTYIKINKLGYNIRTAVNVQSMVFGNMGETSATGVVFTRNPISGENKLFGEFLINAQGEDVVAGIRTPEDINGLSKEFPDLFKQLNDICENLEKHYRDMQDIEFTVEEGKLFILQTRTGKRSAEAAFKIAIDLAKEGLITQKEAVIKIDPNSIDQMLHPRIKEGTKKQVVGKGLPAAPGAAIGKAVFTAERAEELAANDEKVILIRHETSPEDIHGMHASQGILTACGGMTSHAAVVARGMGTPCVCGVSKLVVKAAEKKAKIGKHTIKEGDPITVDGSTGELILGECETISPELSGNFETILNWANEFSFMKIRANADTPEDARIARKFGAQGIGLCRTEHMFFNEQRIMAMREMILSKDKEQKKKALAKLLPYQKEDFLGIFKEMDGFPVTVRLLDPPLHEFLPTKEEDLKSLAKTMDMSFDEVHNQVLALHEVNPMLGHRGCRLMISHPEIAEMQVRALTEAACESHKNGVTVMPEIMIPLVGALKEFLFLKEVVENTMRSVFLQHEHALEIKIGTMVEIPRACLIAHEIAEVADFYSFGTNDLTQMTFGFSRDDVSKFLPDYIESGYLQDDPFQTIDIEGVGKLVSIAMDNTKKQNKNIKVGVCGEHGGDPRSIDFFYNEGFNYVSCSPYRVPIARLAAAQSLINRWSH